MKNTHYEGYLGKRMTRRTAKRRIMQVMEQELTPRQRQIVMGYYMEQKNMPQLAKELGVNKSTISRTLSRGEARLRKYLRY